VAEIHHRPCLQPNRLEAGLKGCIGVELLSALRARDAQIGCRYDHAWHAVVDERDCNPINLVARAAGGEERAACGAGRITKRYRNWRSGARDAVDARVPLIGDPAARRRHTDGGNLVGIFHENRHRRLAIHGLDQSALDCEWADASKDVPAILRVRYNRLVDEYLEEEIINIDP